MARIKNLGQTIPLANQPNPPSGYRATTEDEKYHYCKEYIPEIAGTYKGTLLVCGGGKGMWEDYNEFNRICQEYDTLAVNVAGMVIPKVKHLFSLHCKQISAISQFRKAEFAGDKHIVHSTRIWNGIDYVWMLALSASTSGFMGIVLGYVLGYRKIILCGVPMDGSGYFYKPMVNATFGDNLRSKEIEVMKDKYGEYVRSMSGRSADVLGKPSVEWLGE